nr:fumarylacetoacetate hydrolase family protein [Bryobacter sp.]
MTCTIERAGSVIFSGSVSTSKLNRKIETLVEYLIRSNMVPAGTILLTGTGIIVTQEAALAAGDVVTISVPEIGTLVNPAQVIS